MFFDKIGVIIKAYKRSGEYVESSVPLLNIPELNLDSIYLSQLEQDLRVEPDANEDLKWDKMENELIGFFDSSANTKSKIYKSSNGSQVSGINITCAVGGLMNNFVDFDFEEPVYLHIELYNPMKITITLNDIMPIIDESGNNPELVLAIPELTMNPLETVKVIHKIIVI